MTENLHAKIRKVAALLKNEGAREVYIFGSAVTGALRKDSDVDLAVTGLPPEKYFRAMSGSRRILGRPLDLIDLDEPNPFTRYLLQERELRRVK